MESTAEPFVGKVPPCYNRLPFKRSLEVQDGYVEFAQKVNGNKVRMPRMVTVPWAFTDECNASKSGEAQRLNMRCGGCTWELKRS